MRRRNFLSAFLASIPLLVSSWKSTAGRSNPSQGPIVINAGIGGNTSLDLLERIEKDCLSHNPELTVLMVGTNDMNSMKYIPINEFEKNLRRIVGRILESGSQIVLMNLLPVHEPYLFTRHKPEFYLPEGHKGRLTEMNQLIEKIANEYQLSFLDIHRIFAKVGNVGTDKLSLIKNMENSNVTDGLHPTSHGYRMMGLCVYHHIVHNKLPKNNIVCFGDSITYGDGSIDNQSYPAYLKKLLN